MEAESYISQAIDATQQRNAYDTEVKHILSDKGILSWILKYCVGEFSAYSPDEIRACIEEEPEVAVRSVFPGVNQRNMQEEPRYSPRQEQDKVRTAQTQEQKETKGYSPEAIEGMNTESAIPGEGKVTYDIRFYVLTPDEKHVKIIMNLEAQLKFNPGYDLVTRGVFYCARMLSAQYGTEFTAQDYDGLKKVYSIWLCMDVPKEAEYTITGFRMGKAAVHGAYAARARYDLLEVVLLCLGAPERESQGLPVHRLLNVLLSAKLSSAEKKRIIREEFGIATTVKLEGGIERMCNLSEGVELRGYRRGRQEGRQEGRREGAVSALVFLVRDGLLSAEVAAKRSNMTKEEFEKLVAEE